MAPDGNGGMYAALGSSGVLDELKHSRVRYVHAYCVDNVLVKPADPAFLGHAVAAGSDCASKAVDKRSPDEPAGVFAIVGQSLGVVEYSEISKESAMAVRPDGQLVYGLANIANHVFTVDFLERVAASGELPYHLAKKKIPSIDPSTGSALKVDGYKLEAFLFDAFTKAQRPLIYKVDRLAEFAPLKNGRDSAEDNPETCRRALASIGEH